MLDISLTDAADGHFDAYGKAALVANILSDDTDEEEPLEPPPRECQMTPGEHASEILSANSGVCSVVCAVGHGSFYFHSSVLSSRVNTPALRWFRSDARPWFVRC